MEGNTDVKEEVIAAVISYVTKTQLQQATTDDTVLQAVIRYTASAWPSQKPLAAELLPYYQMREDLSHINNLLLRYERIVIPEMLTSTFV